MQKFFSGPYGGLYAFFAILGVLALVNVSLAFISVPLRFVLPVSLITTVIIVGAPIFGLFYAAKAPWTPKFGFFLLLVGLFVQLALGAVAQGRMGLLASWLMALSQAGLLIWCSALGALLATLIKDKNLLLPIAFFLAAFDVFLVLTPIGFTQTILKAHPEAFAAVAYQIPKISNVAQRGPVAPFLRIGPADFMFLGMFFVALHRFKMRTAQTLAVLVPTLLGYLAIVLFLGGYSVGRFSLHALPALLPIGTVVIFINRKEFQMTREEKLSTALVGAIALGLIAFGLTRRPVVTKGPPIAPSPKGPVRTLSAPVD